MTRDKQLIASDGTDFMVGSMMYNYYDRKAGTVGRIDADGWFDFKHGDGTAALLNGERICSLATAQARGFGRFENGQWRDRNGQPTTLSYGVIVKLDDGSPVSEFAWDPTGAAWIRFFPAVAWRRERRLDTPSLTLQRMIGVDIMEMHDPTGVLEFVYRDERD